jgi:hypothetical protein
LKIPASDDSDYSFATTSFFITRHLLMFRPLPDFFTGLARVAADSVLMGFAMSFVLGAFF